MYSGFSGAQKLGQPVPESNLVSELNSSAPQHIYMTYTGVGRRAADGSMVIRTVPRFETADERYTWLNSIQAVAHGTTTAGSVTYDVYGLL